MKIKRFTEVETDGWRWIEFEIKINKVFKKADEICRPKITVFMTQSAGIARRHTENDQKTPRWYRYRFPTPSAVEVGGAADPLAAKIAENEKAGNTCLFEFRNPRFGLFELSQPSDRRKFASKKRSTASVADCRQQLRAGKNYRSSLRQNYTIYIK